jgi:hypothetical protein
MFQVLRRAYTFVENLQLPKHTYQSIEERLLRLLVGHECSNSYVPENKDKLDMMMCTTILAPALSSSLTWREVLNGLPEDLVNAGPVEARRYVKHCHLFLVGRCIFVTEQGHIGLAPAGTQKRDVVSVLFGCRFPVVLRPQMSMRQVREVRSLMYAIWRGSCAARQYMVGRYTTSIAPSHG